MVNIKLCVLFLFIGSTYFFVECRAQKPEIAYLSRFLFRLGRSFIPKPGCPSAPSPVAPKTALEEPDDYEEIKEGLALFEPSPPNLATEPPTTEAADETTEFLEYDETTEEETTEETTEEVTEETETEAPEE